MPGICNLDIELNKCPNYSKDTQLCGCDETDCGFWSEIEERSQASTEKQNPKWFEQYYQ